ncbi:MAG: hypothetical protein J6386_20820 [Candidatus Synoicihabitans palmerolidicus]|nr:hypothetical protein [Candidatus Synoicihabitans palmerolidicus]
MFETSVLTRANLTSSLLDHDVLARLLGPEMKLEDHHTWRRPSGQETNYALARNHAVPASLAVRETLRRVLDSDKDITDVFITTIRGDSLMRCLAPHDSKETLAENSDHFAYVTLQRKVTAEDRRRRSEQRARFEVALNTTYNEVAVARAPLVHPRLGMLGWVELNLPVSSWVAPQAKVHLQVIFAVVLGLGVLGLLGQQRWRRYEKEVADRAVEVEREAAAFSDCSCRK